jgi:salicylate hydroxylase
MAEGGTINRSEKGEGQMAGLEIAICGGGVGGMTVGIGLIKAGHSVTIYEQASQFGRIGADVNLTPNAVHALDSLGVGQELRKTAARPTHRISRMWDTGEETSRLEMADSAEKKYGAPQLTIHRADLLSALQGGLPEGTIQNGKRAASITNGPDGAGITFEDGTSADADILIGADGIHSIVRTALFGEDSPEFTGVVSYRSVVDRDKLSLPNLDAFTKWWGPIPESQIVTFPLNQGRETFVFATTPQDDWLTESWTLPGDVDELRAAYADFHQEARALLEACTEVTKSALYVREPMPQWSVDRTTLLGDACHPMVPFMAQGACMAIEDAVVLARCLADTDAGSIAASFSLYEAARKERTARVQEGSRGNEWMKVGGNADWVYGYLAAETPLNG